MRPSKELEALLADRALAQAEGRAWEWPAQFVKSAYANLRTLPAGGKSQEGLRDLTSRERNELKIRNAIRREGLTPLSDDAWRAFLAAEFPGLSQRQALIEYMDRKGLMSRHERYLEAKRKSDFAKRYAKVDALRQEIRERMPALTSYQPKGAYSTYDVDLFSEGNRR